MAIVIIPANNATPKLAPEFPATSANINIIKKDHNTNKKHPPILSPHWNYNTGILF